MATKDSQPQLEDQELYEELRKKGDSKEKAARSQTRLPTAGARTSESRAGNRSPTTTGRSTSSRSEPKNSA